MKDKSPISLPQPQPFSAGLTLHSQGGGRQQVPSLSSSSYIIPSMDISLILGSSQGCTLLKDNLTTDVLAPGSPLPAHKYFFLEGNVKRREAEPVPCRDSWSICFSSALCNPFLGPPVRSSWAPLLLLCSLLILDVPYLSIPPKQQGTGMRSAPPHESVLSAHAHLPQGHVLSCIYTVLRKKQASVLVAL